MILDFSGLEQLWEQAGGQPNLAPTMAAIAEAESGGDTASLNDNPSTGDYSVGPWQINYFRDLYAPRAARYGTPNQLIANPVLDAKAAVDLAGGGSGLSNWTTYTSGAYRQYMPGGSAAPVGNGGGGGGVVGTVKSIGSGIASIPGDVGGFLSKLNPVSGVEGAIRDAAGAAFSWGARLGASGIGLALIVLGLNRAFGVSDRIHSTMETAGKAAEAGAMVA